MSDTTMYTKGLSDGWFLVASASDNVSIKSNSDGFWHVAVADERPADGFVGEKYSGVRVKQITGLSGNVYLRAASAHSFAVTVGDPVEMPDVSGGAAKVADGFRPSQYEADLAMDGTAQAAALATGVGRVYFANLGATTEAIRVAFGTSAANAESNLNIAGGLATTGHYIPAPAEGGSQSAQTLGVPALATHYAIANAVAADTQLVSVTQGL